MAFMQTMEVKDELTTRLTIGFRCHPNYGNDLRRQYNTILADINDSNLLPFIASQVANQQISARKVGKIPREVILNANYTLSWQKDPYLPFSW